MDDILSVFDLEVVIATTKDGSWMFKKLNGQWHFKDSRSDIGWVLFPLNELEMDLVFSSNQTERVPRIISRTKERLRTIPNVIKFLKTMQVNKLFKFFNIKKVKIANS